MTSLFDLLAPTAQYGPYPGPNNRACTVNLYRTLPMLRLVAANGMCYPDRPVSCLEFEPQSDWQALGMPQLMVGEYIVITVLAQPFWCPLASPLNDDCIMAPLMGSGYAARLSRNRIRVDGHGLRNLYRSCLFGQSVSLLTHISRATVHSVDADSPSLATPELPTLWLHLRPDSHLHNVAGIVRDFNPSMPPFDIPGRTWPDLALTQPQ